MRKPFLNLSVKITGVAVLWACMLGVFLWSTAASGDTVRVGRRPYLGTIEKITPDAVTIKSSSGETEIPTNKITAVRFDKEPREVTKAREAVARGQFEDAIKALGELGSGNLDGPIAADAAFYEAAATAELALRGRTPSDNAIDKLRQFLKNYPDSFHYYKANRLLADLLTASGQPDAAVSSYQNLAKAPWTEYQIDADIATVAVLFEAGKTADAQKLLAEISASGDLDATQKNEVALLVARDLINQNQLAEAIAHLEKLIQTTPPDEIDINSQAYNLLGRAHRRSDQPQDALLAFLHVDMLYPGNATAHAEALGNLVELWTAEHKPDRAELATETLKQRYPHSRWNK